MEQHDSPANLASSVFHNGAETTPGTLISTGPRDDEHGSCDTEVMAHRIVA